MRTRYWALLTNTSLSEIGYNSIRLTESWIVLHHARRNLRINRFSCSQNFDCSYNMIAYNHTFWIKKKPSMLLYWYFERKKITQSTLKIFFLGKIFLHPKQILLEGRNFKLQMLNFIHWKLIILQSKLRICENNPTNNSY